MNKLISITTLLAVGSMPAFADVYTWSGAAGDNIWGNPGNWTNNNGYDPQSDYDSAVIGENAGTIIWSVSQGYFGASNEITIGKGSEVICEIGGGVGDFNFNTLNLYGTFSATCTNALGFNRDFTLNFGDISATEHGFFDLSGVTGTLWSNEHNITVTASATLSGSGELELIKLGGSVYSFDYDMSGIEVNDTYGNALILNSGASSVEDLSVGEYALIASGAGNGGLTILYSAPIPEPSAFGLLAGLCALALVGTRRRRR